MKSHVLAMAAVALTLGAGMTSCTQCTQSKEPQRVDMDSLATYSFHDSCRWGDVILNLTLPTAQTTGTQLMRDSLTEVFYKDLAFAIQLDEEGSPAVAHYEGEKGDYQALVNHYGNGMLKAMKEWAEDVYEEDEEYVRCEIALEMEPVAEEEQPDTARMVLYDSMGYQYMGGAHGGVIGSGYTTIVKETGAPFRNFLKENSAITLQTLICKGLAEYFETDAEGVKEELLIYNDEGERVTEIPLPIADPQPTTKGLTFIYSQYEIAPYAAGTPSFSLTYEQLKDCMTDEAKALLMH